MQSLTWAELYHDDYLMPGIAPVRGVDITWFAAPLQVIPKDRNKCAR
jgi:hypothetical protein